MKIRTKLAIALILVSIIPLAVMGVLLYINSEGALTEQVLNQLESIASIQKGRVEGIFDQNRERLVLVSSRTQLRNSLVEFGQDGESEHQDRMNKILDDALSSIPSFRTISVMDTDGKVVASTDREAIGSDFSGRGFFKSGKAGIDIDNLFLRPDASLGLYMSGPLTLEGEEIGVVVIESDADKIVGVTGDYSGLGETGETLLADKESDGDVLFLTPLRFDADAAMRRSVSPEDSEQPVVRAFTEETQELEDAPDYRGESVIATTRYLAEPGWVLVVKTDRAEALAPISRQRNTAILIITAAFVVAAGIYLYMTRVVTRPMVRLTEAVRSIGAGDLDQRVEVESKDEAGVLAAAFNRMTENLRETTVSRDILAGEVEERKIAEAALQAEKAFTDAALNSLSDVFLVFNREGEFIRWNRVVREVSGYSDEELSRMRPTDFFSEDGGAKVAEAIADAFDKGHASVEADVVTKTGERIPYEFTGSVLEGGGEDFAGMCVVGRDITDRREADRILRESEEKYRALADNLPQVVFETDENGIITYVNDAAYRIFRYSPEDLATGVPILEVIDETDRKRVAGAVTKMMTGESEGATREYLMKRKDGTTFPALVYTSLIGDKKRPGGIRGLLTDITERKEAEEERERLLHQLTERVKELNGLYGLSKLVEKPGVNLEDIYQGTVEIIPRSFRLSESTCARIVVNEREYTTADYRDTSRKLVSDIKVYGEVQGSMEVGYLGGLSPGGEEPFLEEERRLLDAFAERLGRITERWWAQEELRIRDSAMEVSINAIAFAGMDGALSYVNRSFLEIWGYEDEAEVLGREATKFWQMEEQAEAVVEALSTEGHWVGELPAKRKDGSAFYVQLSATLVKDESGNPILMMGSFLDITEQKRAEAERKKMMEELARSNEELERFAYIASHDLQEPLRAISSYMQLLERRYEGKLDEKADKFIDHAVNGAKRMQRLINDLLDYSRVTTRGREFEPTDMEEVLEEVLRALRVAIKESGAEVTHDRLPSVLADPLQMSQLLQNLIGNAIKFRGDENPKVNVSVERRGDDWLFSVSDNGIGIDPKYAGSVFEVFRRLHGRDEYPGTGIGLSLCQRIVERHGGRIWVDSNKGEGSVFKFTIPATRGEENE